MVDGATNSYPPSGRSIGLVPVTATGGTTARTLADWMADQREKLTAARTYYVRPDGDDDNTGLTNTTGGAFLTIQAAIDAAYSLNLADAYAVTIQLADGTYTGGAYITGLPNGTQNDLVGAPIIIRGNASSPENVIISTTSAHCLYAADGAKVQIRDVELRTTTSGNCIYAFNNATVFYGNVRFGACAGSHKQAFNGSILYNGHNAAGGVDFAVVGSAVSHEHITTGSVSQVLNATVTVSGTPAFSSYFVGVSFGFADWSTGVTISGSATGPRYTVLRNGVIKTPASTGETFFPGNSAGIATTGGKYLFNNGAADGSNTPYIIDQSGASASHTGDTSETTLATIAIPAGAMGANGRLVVDTIWQVTASTNAKTIRVRYNATAFGSGAISTAGVDSVVMRTIIANANSESAQVGGPSNFPDSFGLTSANVVTSAHDTTGALNLTITAQLADSGETITLLHYSVRCEYSA